MRQSNSVTDTDAGRVFFSASENTGHSDGSCKCPPAVVMREALQRHQERDRPLGAGDQAAHMLGQLLQFASFGAHRGNCLVVAVRAGWWRDVSDLAHG